MFCPLISNRGTLSLKTNSLSFFFSFCLIFTNSCFSSTRYNIDLEDELVNEGFIGALLCQREKANDQSFFSETL